MSHLENPEGRKHSDSTECHPYGIAVLPISCHSFIPQNFSIVEWMGDWGYIPPALCIGRYKGGTPCFVGRHGPPFSYEFHGSSCTAVVAGSLGGVRVGIFNASCDLLFAWLSM